MEFGARRYKSLDSGLMFRVLGASDRIEGVRYPKVVAKTRKSFYDCNRLIKKGGRERQRRE
jgi:hypothetical protein